jgi:hypothetical protein
VSVADRLPESATTAEWLAARQVDALDRISAQLDRIATELEGRQP